MPHGEENRKNKPFSRVYFILSSPADSSSTSCFYYYWSFLSTDVHDSRTTNTSQSLHLIGEPKIRPSISSTHPANLPYPISPAWQPWPPTHIVRQTSSTRHHHRARNSRFDCKSDLHHPNVAPASSIHSFIRRICTFRSRVVYRILKAHTHTSPTDILLAKVLGCMRGDSAFHRKLLFIGR